ncbi:c-type cytochrome [Algibacillus agarilyticus]|uniref:c-type cytochrome n=1 Tax=Algibacillus agarilyticus TaxID=2234133 RepID=UPI00130080FC|nr:cytochrome c [Algibacillus agarilyticus]
MANTIDDSVVKMSLDENHVKAGQQLFNSVCAACHKKDLSGAMGFNLKDGEWIHGSKPSDIVKNIKDGFSTAGMPAFKMMYSDEQIQQIAAYVVSKREGWDNLTYKIYQLPDSKERALSQLKTLSPVKEGRANKNLADFQMPETKEFAAVFEGEFYAPKTIKSLLVAKTVPQIRMDVYIDGEKVSPNGKWHRNWLLKPGKQHLRIEMMTPPVPFPKWTHTNLNLLVTNVDQTIKLIPVTTRAKSDFEGINIELKATNKALVQRKKVVDLPTYTVSVGLPEKLNYGFNTRSCAIAGVWQGDLLNVGPNVKGRGQDGSIMLGKVAFNYPQQINVASQSTCEFIKYNRQGNPSFHYKIDDLTLKVQASAKDKNTLSFNYQVLTNPEQQKSLMMSLPTSDLIHLSTEQGVINNKQLKVDLTNQTSFTIDVAIKGEK